MARFDTGSAEARMTQVTDIPNRHLVDAFIAARGLAGVVEASSFASRVDTLSNPGSEHFR